MWTASTFPVCVLVFAGLCSQAPAGGADQAEEEPARGEGDRITVGKRAYAIRFLKQPVVGDVEASRAFCLWNEGTAWVIDPLRPDLQDRFACPWPIETVSRDRSLAVVRLPKQQDRLAVADLRQQKLVAEFPDPDHELLSSSQWIFSKTRKHVYCLDGTAIGGWYYLDLALNKRVQLSFPDFRPSQNGHAWSGAVLADGKQAVLFFSGFSKTDGKRRLQFPVDEIERRSVAAPEVGITYVLHVEKDHLLAFYEGWNYGMISTRTWKVVKQFDWGGDIPGQVAVPLAHAMGPKGRHAYLIDSVRDLIVYDVQTGKLVKQIRLADAPQRRVTFSSDGRYGVAPTKSSHIGFFDAASHEIVQEVRLERPPSMAFLIEPRHNEAVGTCLVVYYPARGEP